MMITPKPEWNLISNLRRSNGFQITLISYKILNRSIFNFNVTYIFSLLFWEWLVFTSGTILLGALGVKPLNGRVSEVGAIGAKW